MLLACDRLFFFILFIPLLSRYFLMKPWESFGRNGTVLSFTKITYSSQLRTLQKIKDTKRGGYHEVSSFFYSITVSSRS